MICVLPFYVCSVIYVRASRCLTAFILAMIRVFMLSPFLIVRPRNQSLRH